MVGRGRQSGATILEGALTILLLFTLLFAIIEFGRAYNTYQIITNAAREGARFSVAPFPGTSTLPTVADVQAQAQLFLDSGNIAGGTIAVDQGLSTPVNGVATLSTQVTVSAPYSFIFFPFGSVTMTSQAVMRNETN